MISTAKYEELFYTYQPRLVRFAVRFVDEETADDIVQTVFLKVWEKRNELRLDNIQALLFQMVRNECLNELKRRVANGAESLDELMETEGAEQLYWQDFAPDADTILISKELEQQIRQALCHVSEKTRNIFQMSRQEGLKPKEIAEQLGITRQAVVKHINAALEAIRTNLSKNLLPLVAFLECILLYE